jgi:hypothetical protein
MVGNYYDWNIIGNIGVYVNVKSSSQNMQTAQQCPVEIIYALFMGLISKNIKTKPLQRMENDNGNPKQQVKNGRKGIAYDFLE